MSEYNLSMNLNDKQKWTLITLLKAKSKGLTPAQLQKTLFLLQKAFPKKLKDFYHFKPYNYGPFDIQVYINAEKLASEGLINLYPVKNGWSIYSITKTGEEVAKQVERQLDKPLIEYLDKVVKWAQSLTFQELISSIYKKYPEYKINSVFGD